LETKLTQKDIKIYPWIRGYILTCQNQNTVLFATARTPEREELFKWVGPIVKDKKSVIISKKSKNIKTNTIKDLKKYRIGTIKEDVAGQLLRKEGLEESIIPSVDIKINLTRLSRSLPLQIF